MKTIPSGLLIAFLSIVGICGVATPASAANLVSDGGFEAAIPFVYGPGPIGDGWYVGSGSIDILDTSGGIPHTGQQFADLDFAGAVNSLYQDIATVPGTRYNVSFWLSDDVGSNQLTVTFGSSTLFNGLTPALGSGNYELLSYFVAATGTTSTLTFDSQYLFNGPGVGAVLDDVSVTQGTPEPTGLVLFASGVTTLACAIRRRLKP